jgi:hypothetical protein
MMGIKLDLIIGMDVLGRWPWLLDWQGKKLTFFRKAQKYGGTVIPARESEQSHVIVEFEVNGEKREGLLDTGAPLQFKDADYKCGNSLREQADFSPLIHEYFATPIYQIPISFAGERFEAEFGVLPPKLQNYMDLIGVRWILGGPCLKRHPVYWDIPNGCIHILNQGGAAQEIGKEKIVCMKEQ